MDGDDAIGEVAGVQALLVLTVAYVAAGLLAAVIAVTSWSRRRATPAAYGLAIAMLGATWWAWGDGVLSGLLLVAPAATDGRFIGLVSVGSAILVMGFVLLTRAISDPQWRPSRRAVLLLGVEPVVVLVAGAADPWLHLIVASTGSRGALAVPWTPGPGLWAHALYSYALLGVVIGLLAAAGRNTSALHRRQVLCILFGGLVPAVGNAVTLLAMRGGGPVPDLSGITFSVTGLVDGYALFRLGLLRLVPVGRSLVLDRLTDAVVVLDPDGRILDLNPAGQSLARRLAPDLPANLAGIASSRVTRGYSGVPDPIADGVFPLRIADVELVVDVRVEDVTDRRGRLVGRVAVARDVTEVHRQGEELAAVNDRLRRQIETVDGLRAELAELAVRDELTGLHNRRYLVTALRREIELARLRDAPLCVVLLDLDHFKSVNDRHGHAVGDDVLAAIARVLAAALRDHDSVARYGGEEFVVLLPGATLDQAMVRAQQWRLRCSEVVVPSADGPVTTTVSAGVAVLGAEASTPQALLQAADEALYAAKAAGRNRVVPAGALS